MRTFRDYVGPIVASVVTAVIVSYGPGFMSRVSPSSEVPEASKGKSVRERVARVEQRLNSFHGPDCQGVEGMWLMERDSEDVYYNIRPGKIDRIIMEDGQLDDLTTYELDSQTIKDGNVYTFSFKEYGRLRLSLTGDNQALLDFYTDFGRRQKVKFKDKLLSRSDKTFKELSSLESKY